MSDWTGVVTRVLSGTSPIDLEVMSADRYSDLTDRVGEDVLPADVVTVVRAGWHDGDWIMGGDLMFDSAGVLLEDYHEMYGDRLEGHASDLRVWMGAMRGE